MFYSITIFKECSVGTIKWNGEKKTTHNDCVSTMGSASLSSLGENGKQDELKIPLLFILFLSVKRGYVVPKHENTEEIKPRILNSPPITFKFSPLWRVTMFHYPCPVRGTVRGSFWKSSIMLWVFVTLSWRGYVTLFLWTNILHKLW